MSERYEQKLREQEERHEAACRKCGACCGAFDGDPCVNLAEQANGTFECKVYEKRLGPQVTVSGKRFNCVPIRDLLKRDYAYSQCPYAMQGC
ncbi:MAG: hypothetical protein PHR11_06435 [Candidatus Omnitrophica bacterium]|nr:hypothetical protein [Candidatus Omnitrophota bacterium]